MRANLTRLPITIAAACAALSLAPAQTDRIVGGSQPGSYPTLQAAITAAAPGDRILIAQDMTVLTTITLNKALRIESAPGARRSISFINASFSAATPLFSITALPAGASLELANLAIDVSTMGLGSFAMRTASPQLGEVRFDGVTMLDLNGWRIGVLVDLSVGSAWIRNCSFTQRDQPQDGACPDGTAWGNAGGCLRVRAQRLVIEDSTLRAASGAWIYSHPDNCFGCIPGGTYVMNSPRGGFALDANTTDTFLVRVRTSDGNGGGAQPPLPPCGSYGIPAPAGTSTFHGIGGALHAYDFVHEWGVPGTLSSASPPFDAPRGLVTQVGDVAAPLRLFGNAQLGGGIQANVSEPGISLLAMAFAWSPTNTPVGRIAFDPLQEHFTFLVFTPTPPSTQSWNVPNDPFLSGLPIVTQLFPFDPTNGAWRAANPSAITLRRP